MNRDESSRQFPKCMPNGWVPPVPAWSALAPHDGQLIVAYYGVQSAHGADAREVGEFRDWLLDALRHAGDAVHSEYAAYTDAQGYHTWLCISYWLDEARHAHWEASLVHQDYWLSDVRLSSSVGVFREILTIPADRFEALQSDTQERVGAAHVCPVLHGPIREHNYWGVTRDRIAASGYDQMASDSAGLTFDALEGGTLGRRVRVQIPSNLAVIRSGQAYGDLQGQEKDIYFGEIEPALRAGMDFLSDHPLETGCFSCRLLRETDASGLPLSRSFGLAHFTSLSHLEDWARNHPTHLRIFNSFVAMATKLGGDLKLRLWHEVAVLPAHGQIFEYINCHPDTGLLAQAKPNLFSSSQDSGVQA
ncbi:phenylacetaldoxime dehydratase family protein [Pseudomonas sp. NPDC098747]|uniref:phenylacetaldoxime dehydratase family protein n=1 Tax=Pseudomonas sp. NPDC098747 TaxID=3364487 RepID=UPI00383B3DD5